MSYTLLRGIRVLEVAWLAGDTVGQHLADLGADVIKVERPGEGDYVRTVGPVSLGGDEGLSFMHLEYNRGKRSVELNLQTEEGRETFLRLTKGAHVVIEGLRSGAMARWGLGYDELREVNPAIVFCTLSGMGASGPYKDLPTHGFFYDAFTGLAPPDYIGGGRTPRVPERGGLLEYKCGGLYAAIGVLGALVKAIQTGEGSMIEVAQTEAMSLIRAEKIQVALNPDKVQRRRSYGDGVSFVESTRSNYYWTADDRIVFVQALETKFWENLCRAGGRQDLIEKYPSRLEYDHVPGNEDLRRELQEMFRTRTLADWVQTFIEHNIPGGPVYSLDELAEDPHFRSRPNVAEVEYPTLGRLTLVTTPIRVAGEVFEIPLAPDVGQHTDLVLAELEDEEASGGTAGSAESSVA